MRYGSQICRVLFAAATSNYNQYWCNGSITDFHSVGDGSNPLYWSGTRTYLLVVCLFLLKVRILLFAPKFYTSLMIFSLIDRR